MNGSSLSTTMFERALALEPVAWQRIVDLYQPFIYGKCRRNGLQESDARDVTQEVLKAAYKDIRNFHRDRPGASFRAWLMGITAHKLLDYREAKANTPQTLGGTDAQQRLAQLADSAPESSASVELPDDADKNRLARRALELIRTDFQENTWKAFWRFQIDGQPAAAVAAELGMTPNAVHIATSRVRKRLHEEFGDFI